MPTGLIEKNGGVGAGGNDAGDLFEMTGHGVGVAPRHDEGAPFPGSGRIAPNTEAETVR